MFKIIFSREVEHSSWHTSCRQQGGFMPYAAGHRPEVKQKIVQSARRLFNRNGFENVSISQIMAGAGLTHGGFYSYFKSKSELYSELLGCFFTDPQWRSRWEGVDVDLSSSDAGPQVVRANLFQQHFEDVENSCPMTALPTDVSRSGRGPKTAFETIFQAMVRVLEGSSIQNGRPRRRRETAQAIAALCVGGMVVARAMAKRAIADELREACMAVALNLGGWEKASESKARKSKRRVRA